MFSGYSMNVLDSISGLPLLVVVGVMSAVSVATAQVDGEPVAAPVEVALPVATVAAISTAAPPATPTVGLTPMEAVPGGLTAVQAGKRAAETSRAVFRKRQETRMKEADVDRVVWRSIPRLSFSARYARLSKVNVGGLGDDSEGGLVGTTVPAGELIPPGEPLRSIGAIGFPDPLLNNYSLGANLTVPLSNYVFKLADTMEAARATPEISALETQVEQQAAAVEAKMDYYAWAQAKLNVLVAERAMQQATERMQDMQRLLNSGRVAQVDLLQAQAFAATTALTGEQARTAELLSERKLAIVLHAEPGEVLRIGENVLLEPLAVKAAEDPFAEAVRQRPELGVLARSLKALGARTRVLEAGAYPTIEAFADVSYSNPNPRVFPQQDKFEPTWQVGLQLNWSLNDMGVAKLDAQDSEISGNILRSQLREIKDALQLEVLTATRGMKEARLNIQTARQLQQVATAAYEARSTLFRNGRATSFEILQAETARINAEFGLVGAHIALHVAKARFDHALGRPLY